MPRSVYTILQTFLSPKYSCLDIFLKIVLNPSCHQELNVIEIDGTFETELSTVTSTYNGDLRIAPVD